MHLPSCFLATWVPYSLEEKAELKTLRKCLCGALGGCLQGSLVVGTQGAVVAVGDAVCPADLAQDVGTGCDGLSGFGPAQVRAAVNLGRQNSNAGSVSPLHFDPLDLRGLC